MFSIVNIVSVVLLLLIITVAVVKGYKRGAGRSILRLILLIASIVAGYFTTKYLIGIIYELVETNLSNWLIENNEFGLTLQEIEALVVVAKATIVPLTFIIVTFIIDKVALILYLILKLAIKKPQSEGNKRFGVFVSILTSVISLGAWFLPLNGYIGIVNEGLDNFNGTTIENVAFYTDAINKGIEKIEDGFLFKCTDKISRKTFDFLATEKYTSQSGKTYKLVASKELLGICELYPVVEEYINSEDGDVLNTALLALDYKGKNSILSVKISLAKIMRQASKNWKNGEEFFGLNLKENLDSYNTEYFPTIIPLLTEIESCTEDNVVEYLSSANNLLKGVEKADIFTENIKNYANKISNATATSSELDQIVKEMSEMYDLMDEKNRSVFYEVIKINAKSFVLQGEADIAFSYFFGIVLQNLRDIKDLPIYTDQVSQTNTALIDLYALLNAEVIDLPLFNKVLEAIAIENGTIFKTINNCKEFNLSHNNEIKLKITQSNKILLDAYIDEAKNNYSSNENIKSTLDNLKGLIIAG